MTEQDGEVLIIVGDATETVDTLYPFLRVEEDGFAPIVAGPEARRYHMVMHEPPAGWDVTREFEGYTIQANIAFRDIKPEEYAGIFFSGGRAPEYLRYDQDLIRITQWFFDNNKPIACVCHGVEIPCAADRVRGRRMATVNKCALDLEFSGGTFVDEACVIDGNLISGRVWCDHGHYMKHWMALLIEERTRMNAEGK